MSKKIQYNDYLKKSFIQYAIVIILLILLLIIGFFAFNYYLSVIKQNKESNDLISDVFIDEYHTYKNEIITLSKDDETKKVFDDNDNTLSKRLLSETLHKFVNNTRLKGYYVVVNRTDEIILSNLNKDNQDIFLNSLFYRKNISRLNEYQTVDSHVNDLDFVKNQDCIYSFSQIVENDDIVGYLFLFIRKNDFVDYIDKLNEEVIIIDRYDNTIFSSFDLPKDPGEKMPETRVKLNLNDKQVVEINNVRMYVRLHHMLPEDIKIYTLTSIERNMQMFKTAAIFFLGMAIIIGIFAYIMAKLYTRLNERTVSELMSNLEIKNLEEQFNPHFVFNVMESVRFQIDENPSKAQDMLLAFSTLMRYSINHGQTKVRLETDIDYLNDFLMLQKIRYNNLLTFEFDIPDELLDCLIPKLLLQPIVENSIKHAYVAGKPLHITITGEHVENDLLLKVTDDGKGITDQVLLDISQSFNEDVSHKNIKHIGLYHVQTIINKLYGDKYGLKIDSKENDGTTVLITIPYEVEEEDV